MVEVVHCSAAKFVEVGRRILETFPLVHIMDIHSIQGRGTKLAACRELSAARSLGLSDLADDDGEQIVRSLHLTRVEKLQVAFPRCIDLAWLLDMPVARQLWVLDLTGSQLSADVLGLFGQTDATAGLETLVLARTGMDDEMARRLSEVTTLRSRKRLSVADNHGLGPAGIAAIVRAEFAPRLETLCIDGKRLDDFLVQQLVESLLASTIHLSINHGYGGKYEETIVERFPNRVCDDDSIRRYL